MGAGEIVWRSIIGSASAAAKGISSPTEAMAAGPIYEGVFAINKPGAISSAQVIRDVQTHFNPSNTFKPWLSAERAKLDSVSHNQRKKRRSWKSQQSLQVKIGHGGTLDPMATGVLILGIGSGTKSLNKFLECTKSYECVLLFGAATDTYDSEGKVVARKPYQHITREKVEQALGKFRGKIMQRPPIFSALRVQGKRLYEYAREGKEVPIEIQERPVEVENLEISEWMDGGTHQWRWPDREAETEEKAVVGKVLHLKGGSDGALDAQTEPIASKKRQADDGADGTVNGAVEPDGPPSPKRSKTEAEPMASGALPNSTAPTEDSTNQAIPTTEPIPSAEPEASPPSCPAPAVRIRMTVTSGFYVRSLCHDLGAALGSLGIMTSLVRTRQGDFKLGSNVLEYDNLARGEEVWAPQVKKMLEEWQQKSRAESSVGKTSGNGHGRAGESKKGEPGQRTQLAPEAKTRRNTSSEED